MNCPFCASDNLKTQRVGHGWAVTCLQCEAQGPPDECQDRAKELFLAGLHKRFCPLCYSHRIKVEQSPAPGCGWSARCLGCEFAVSASAGDRNTVLNLFCSAFPKAPTYEVETCHYDSCWRLWNDDLENLDRARRGVFSAKQNLKREDSNGDGPLRLRIVEVTRRVVEVDWPYGEGA